MIYSPREHASTLSLREKPFSPISVDLHPWVKFLRCYLITRLWKPKEHHTKITVKFWRGKKKQQHTQDRRAQSEYTCSQIFVHPLSLFLKSDIFFNNFQTDQRFRGNVTNGDLHQLTSCTRAGKHKRESSEELRGHSKCLEVWTRAENPIIRNALEQPKFWGKREG